MDGIKINEIWDIGYVFPLRVDFLGFGVMCELMRQ